ncbi:RNA polymerase II C-terminal domain phosphatase-like 4 [Chenopodium quinoa]|uniref:RNA polymerase II C-terminal domain phosphatase-like 4 n=1 Tax=Chenopodium quinoa TaxID=63459 RepID=UPI000B786E49|nr:RNA polymerase II C-terminal domain phosphatase-like 4 [Chenopodium quinoa]
MAIQNLKATVNSSSSSIRANSIKHVRDENLKTLLSKKKLHLVLDLDNTILESSIFEDLTKYDRDYIQRSVGVKMIEEKKLYQWVCEGKGYKVRLSVFPDVYLTKLRPYVKTFLKEASKLFDKSIFTLGNLAYTTKMLELLDPERLYINSQVITREYVPLSTPWRKGHDLLKSHERVVLVVDDAKDVWEANTKNLIDIAPYGFFDDESSDKKSWTRKWEDESDKYGELARVLRELKKIHKEFYNLEEGEDYESRDVRDAIEEVKRKFSLQGTKQGMISQHAKETTSEIDECFKSMDLNCRRNRLNRIQTSHDVM